MFPVKIKKVLQSFQCLPDQVSDNIDQTSNARGQNGKYKSQKVSKQWMCSLGIGMLVWLGKLIKDDLQKLIILNLLLQW